MALAVGLALLALATAAIFTIIIIDSINLSGEKHSLSWRVERYKVACKFLWFDFKEAVSRKKTSETQAVSCPSDPPESEPGSESEP